MTPSFSSTGRIRKDQKGQHHQLIVTCESSKKFVAGQYSGKGVEQETKLLVLTSYPRDSFLSVPSVLTTTPLLLGVK